MMRFLSTAEAEDRERICGQEERAALCVQPRETDAGVGRKQDGKLRRTRKADPRDAVRLVQRAVAP